MKFPESKLAHEWLDSLHGIEIGGAAHNPFGLKTRNVDFTKETTAFKQQEFSMCGEALPVDIIASGDDLPLDDSAVDFVVASHVLEYFPDPIKALKEWYRVVRPGGYLYIICPHKDRTGNGHRAVTQLSELVERNVTGRVPDPNRELCAFWTTETFAEVILWLGWKIVAFQDVDDKVGNGFTMVVQVGEKSANKPARHAELPTTPEVVVGGSDPSRPSFVEIGTNTYYHPRQTYFHSYTPMEKIVIGSYCSIAREVTIFVGGNHTTDTVATYPFDSLFLGKSNPTRSYRATTDTWIGSDVWIGHGAHIAGGVQIGHGAVIASGAVVFTDVPPYGIAVGNPARTTRFRFSEEIVERLIRIAWWDWPEDKVRANVEWFYRPVQEFVERFDPLV